MNDHLILGAFLSSILSGFVPLVNGEVLAVTAALLVTPAAHIPLIMACAGGQVLAKIGLYGVARWSPTRLPTRARDAIARFETLGHRRGSVLLVLTSAGVGMPPFYLVTVASGVLRLPPASFVAASVVGTLARYSFIVWGATRFTN